MFSYFVFGEETDFNACLSYSLSGRSLSLRIFSSFSVVRFGIAYGTNRLTLKIRQNFEENSTNLRDIDPPSCLTVDRSGLSGFLSLW